MQATEQIKACWGAEHQRLTREAEAFQTDVGAFAWADELLIPPDAQVHATPEIPWIIWIRGLGRDQALGFAQAMTDLGWTSRYYVRELELTKQASETDRFKVVVEYADR